MSAEEPVASPETPEAFAAASAVRPVPDGRYAADVSGEWTIGGRPSGGYLLAVLARAATALTEGGHVVAASGHYLRPPEPGPVDIDGEVLRRGRSVSQVRVRMSQGGKACVEALMSTGALEADPPRWDGGVPTPEVVPPEDCFRLPPRTPDGTPVAMLNHVDLRLDPDSAKFIQGAPTGRGELRGWLRFLSGETVDPTALLYVVDALPPATWDTTVPCWMSTVELTAYVRAVPAPGAVRVVSRARLIDAQWLDQTCDVWDSTGRLVAQASQLAKVVG